MLHEIGNHKFSNEYLIRAPKENDLYVIVKNRKILAKKIDDNYELPSFNTVGKLSGATYLFKIDDVGFFMADDDLEGYEYINARDFRYFENHWLRYGILTGISLVSWYQNNNYCGRCGKPLIKDAKERMLRCECGNMIFPRINPVSIVGIIKDNKMLLTKYTDSGRFARYALVAGFVEFGETLEQATEREIMEETGLKVKNFKYFGSQPWPFSDSLIFGVFCELDGDDTVTFNDNELCVADWLSPEEMPEEKELASITYLMMDEFRRKGRKVLD